MEYDIQKLRRIQLEILDEIDRVCRENGLTYFLAYGTLLGAVRHHGYIPWDDDIDVYMPRKDYERFQEIAASSLGPKYFFRNGKSDPKLWLKFGKVEKRGTVFLESRYLHADIEMGVYVDVFPLDNAVGNTLGTRLKYWLALKLEIMLWNKRGVSEAGWFKRFISGMFPYRFLHWFQDWVTRGNEKGKYFIHYGAVAITRILMPKDAFLPVKRIPFEDKAYCVPGDSDKILRIFFGDDYMIPPPPEKRVTHQPYKVDLGDD